MGGQASGRPGHLLSSQLSVLHHWETAVQADPSAQLAPSPACLVLWNVHRPCLHLPHGKVPGPRMQITPYGGGGGQHRARNLWLLGVQADWEPASWTNLHPSKLSSLHPMATARLTWKNCSIRFILGFWTLVCHFCRDSLSVWSQGATSLLKSLVSLLPGAPYSFLQAAEGPSPQTS